MEKKELNKKEKDSNISVKLSSELLEKVRRKSAETGITASFVIRKALEDWVSNTDQQPINPS